MTDFAHSAGTAKTKPTVIALHCAGANGSEWQQLNNDLGEGFSLIAPNLIGCGGAERWNGKHALTLSAEAACALTIMDSLKEPVHLVGHSYGGAVALRAAIERPAQVASLTLYEPAALHVLKVMGPDGKVALVGLDAVANEVSGYVVRGAYQAAAKRFVEWANGEGSWVAMDSETQDRLVRYIPKVCLEYYAEVSEKTPLVVYSRLNCPVLLLQGERSLEPMRMIAQKLASTMRLASLQTVYGAGHMGPFTHALVVGPMMADHIAAAQARLSSGTRPITPVDQAA